MTCCTTNPRCGSGTAPKTEKPNPTLTERATQAYISGHLRWTFQRSDGVRFHPPRTPDVPRAGQRNVRRAAAMLAAAKRPLMVLGSQTMLRPERVDELVAAVERIGIPVYLSGMARGLLPAGHPLLKRHKRRNALKAADVVVLSGVPQDFRLDYGSHTSRAKVIGINLDRTDLTKNRAPDLGILADPHQTLVQLSTMLPATRDYTAWQGELGERDDARNAEIAAMASEEPSERLNPVAFCRKVDTKLADDSMLDRGRGRFRSHRLLHDVAAATAVVARSGRVSERWA